MSNVNVEGGSAGSGSAGSTSTGGGHTGAGESNGDKVDFGARVDRVSGSAQHAWTTTRDSITELRDRIDISGRVDRNPFATMAAAVGVGYVLGGGIFSPLTGRIVRIGLRMALRAAAIPFIKDELAGLIDAATGTGGRRSAGSARDEDGDEGIGGGRGPRTRQGSHNANQGR